MRFIINIIEFYFLYLLYYIMSIKNSKIFYVDSANRTSGTSSDFTYVLDIPKNETFTHACVLQASIPVSYYLVRKGLNTFTVIENGVPREVYIEEGNYSIFTFLNECKKQLNLNAPKDVNQNNIITYDVTYDSIINKFTFTYVYSLSPAILIVKFRFNNSLNYQCGFDINKDYSFTGDKLVSSNVVNFINENIVNIHSDLTDSHDGILQEIYSYNIPPSSNMVYILSTDFRAYSKKLKTNHSNQFHFKLLDSDKNYLDTNGQNIVFTVLLYSISPYENNVQEYIKYRIQN